MIKLSELIKELNKYSRDAYVYPYEGLWGMPEKSGINIFRDKEGDEILGFISCEDLDV
jgi:hypothetical protein